MYQSKSNMLWKHWDFFCIDSICYLIAYLAVCLFCLGWNTYVPRIYINIICFLLLLNFLITFFMRSFSGILRRSWRKEIKCVFQQNGIAFAFILAYLYLTKQGLMVSRTVIASSFVLTCLSMFAARNLRKRQLRRRVNEHRDQTQIPIVTTEDLAEECLKKLKYQIEVPHFYIKGFVLAELSHPVDAVWGIPVVAGLEDLLEYVRTQVVDEVFLYMRHDDALTQSIVHDLLNTGITVHVGLDRVSNSMPNMFVQSFGDMTVMTTSMKVISPIESAMKRLVDIIGGLVGVCLMAVLFIFVAPAIYIKSPGPIFFSQIRVGKNGRKFKLYKFRSMYMDAEKRKKDLMEQNQMNGLMFKIENDPRIIPGIGTFIRKTSIDEFPQFWNVLKGDMSLVGTRPPTIDEYEQYELHHKSRLAAKPGITGLWQVSGRSDINDFEEIVGLDNTYIQNWSLSLDVKLLFKTVQIVCQRKGAA